MAANRTSRRGRANSAYKHGRCHSPTWTSWQHMLRRCRNTNYPRWDRYGGRGITVCDRWLDFSNFLADMGERPDGMTIDRYPNRDGNYEPGNCRWATPTAQNGNRGNVIEITFDGETKHLKDWSRSLGIKYTTLRKRIVSGWPVEKAFAREVA